MCIGKSAEVIRHILVYEGLVFVQMKMENEGACSTGNDHWDTGGMIVWPRQWEMNC